VSKSNISILSLILFLSGSFAYSSNYTGVFPDTIIVKPGNADSVITDLGYFIKGTDTTSECDIFLSTRSLLKNVRMVSITDSSLMIVKDSVWRVINVSEIRKIVFFAGSGFWKGASIGMGISLAVCGTIGGLYGNFGYGFLFGLMTGLPVALFTGLIGAFAEQPDVYYFSKMNTRNKIRRIRYIMEKHK